VAENSSCKPGQKNLGKQHTKYSPTLDPDHIHWSAKKMDHGSFSSTFLKIYCRLNILVYSFTLCSCVTLPLVWTNLSENWGLEDIFVLMAIFSSWKKKYVLVGKGAKRCFWLTWMSISKISRKYWALMSVEYFENGLFCQKQAKKGQNSRLYRCNHSVFSINFWYPHSG